MSKTRSVALVLALTIIISLLPAFFIGGSALTARQEYFLEFIGTYARVDMHNTGILASLTTAQAILESGWGSSVLALEGKNLFGIKAYSTWDGLVYDRPAEMLYASYDDFLIASGCDVRGKSLWRAYGDWTESIHDHSTLFTSQERYAAVRGETDYRKAAQAVVDGGYINDDGYPAQLVKIIEDYDLMQYDNLTPDENGIIALAFDKGYVSAGVGREFILNCTVYRTEAAPPEESSEASEDTSAEVSKDTSAEVSEDSSAEVSEDTSAEVSEDTSAEVSEDTSSEVSEDTSAEVSEDTSSEVSEETPAAIIVEPQAADALVWESLNPSVATVDATGRVTVVGEGSVLIRASLGGVSTCCLIDVSDTESEFDGFCTANLNVRAEPNGEATVLGKYLSGQGLYIHGAEQDGWLYCSGTGSNGEQLTGWSFADYIELTANGDDIGIIGFAKRFYTVPAGKSTQIIWAAGPATALDKPITWESSDSAIVTVDQTGIVTGVSNGTAVVTAKAEGGAFNTCRVDVSDVTQVYRGIVTANLYVREQPDESARYLGIFAEDTQVKVTGEDANGWYKLSGTTTAGKSASGWSKSRFVVIDGIDSEMPDTSQEVSEESDESSVVPVESLLFSSDAVLVYNDRLYGLEPGTTAGSLAALSLCGELYITDTFGAPLFGSAVLTTGCTVSMLDSPENSAVVIIKGDVNHDGKIGASDYLLVKRHFLGITALDENAMLAADASRNGETDVTDYIMIVRHFLGTYTIKQEAVLIA